MNIAIAESDVEDYPGLWLRGTSNNALDGVFPPYPLKEELRKNSDRDFQVTENAKDYTRRKPGQALLISAAVGFVLGLIIRGRR